MSRLSGGARAQAGAGNHHNDVTIAYKDGQTRSLNIRDAEAILQEYIRDAGNPERNEIVAVHYFMKNTTGEAALQHNLSALAETPDGHSVLAERHQNVAGSYAERYRRTRNLEDLGAAIDHSLSALSATPDGHPSIIDKLQTLSVLYTSRYTHAGDLADLEAALMCGRELVAGTPLGHPDLAERHQSLATSYSHRHRRTGDLDDLEAALRYNLAATVATPDGHPDLAERHQSLALSYTDKYRRTGNLENLESALGYDLLAVAATPEDHPHLPIRHQSLAISYLDRFKRTGDLKDLGTAIQYNLSGLAATAEGDPNLAGRQQKVAVSYTTRYRQTGNIEDLEAAIKYNTLAMAATPNGRPDPAVIIQSLAVSYMDRFQRTGDLEDMQNAISYNMLSVSTTPTGHPELPARYRNVAVSHLDRYKRNKDMEDLETALKYNLLAIAHTPTGHPDLAGRYQNLGGAYNERYTASGNPSDLEAALKCALLAVAITPKGDSEFAIRQDSLAICYTHKYIQSNNLADLEAALKCNLAAVVATPDGHPGLASIEQKLARSHLLKYAATTDEKDLKTAYMLFKSAINSKTAPPQDIWDISVDFSNFREVLPLQDILEAYITAFNILPSLLWLGSSLHNRHDLLVRNDVSNFTAAAVAFALQVSKLELAVEFFEQGLSTTHKQTLQLRSEHTKLQASLPTVAQRIQYLSVQLQRSPQTSDSSVNYHMLAHERQQLIYEVRQHIGFEDFLLPPKYLNLCTASANGPVILLSCGSIQTDAIIILSPSVHPLHLCLSGAPVSVVEEQLEILRNALNQFSIQSRDTRYGKPSGVSGPPDNSLSSVTAWMWDTVVKPIFDALMENGINHGRLWWCLSGPFTYLPLHAAAPLESRFIQSYTPTLDTLIEANKKHTPSKRIDMLAAIGIIEAPTILGTWANLPFVEEELNVVTTLFEPHAHQLKDSQATLENVVKEMQISSWVHLACHGHQDLADPLKSGLILYDGKLELGQILSTNLSNAKFAYLSACETAMGDSKLVNEAMHLAGGFLAAGYQGAIGTLWSMPDIYGPKVAEVVYKTVFGEDNIPDAKKAAEGLHLAIQKLRKDGALLHQWMPFIHIGI